MRFKSKEEREMFENTLNQSIVDSFMERLTELEEEKDELLVKITFLRDLLEKQEDQLKRVRKEEDAIARQLSVSSRALITEAA